MGTLARDRLRGPNIGWKLLGPFGRNETFTWENFEQRVIIYENVVDVEDLNLHKPSFTKLVEAQRWKIVMMSTMEINIALPQVQEFYFTLDKDNSGYYNAKVDRQEFLRPMSLIFEVLGVPGEGDRSYIDNVRISSILDNYIAEDEKGGTVLAQGTNINNPMKAEARMTLIFW